MLQGQQVTPHKYVRRVKLRGKWRYVYADKPSKAIDPTSEGLNEYKVVIAGQKPTPILVNSISMIMFGPPQTMGKKLFVNTNKAKGYFGIAKNLDGSGKVYLYPESALVTSRAKKAAKFLNSKRALQLIDISAGSLMRELDPVDQQYGLAMWLNNNTKLRVGAKEGAASVDASERRKIINQARAENWSDTAKEAALAAARIPTFGLLTSRAGHIKLNPQTHVAQWSFRGKGGKMITGDNVAIKLPDLQYYTLSKLVNMKNPDEKVFPDVQYKRMWSFYKKYEITPHMARGAYAEEQMNSLMKSFKRNDEESSKGAYTRFKQEVKEKISDKLGHTVDMTMRAYISETTKRGLDKAFERSQSGSNVLESAGRPDGAEALAELVVWLEVGPGNVVV